MVLSISPDSSVTSGCRQILSASDATMLSKDIKPRQKMYLRNPDFSGMAITSLPGQKILFTFLSIVQYNS